MIQIVLFFIGLIPFRTVTDRLQYVFQYLVVHFGIRFLNIFFVVMCLTFSSFLDSLISRG